MKLNPMKTAPNDSAILLHVGLPWLVYGCWNEHEQCWVYADLSVNMVNGKYNDPYFETDWVRDAKGWLPIPEIDE